MTTLLKQVQPVMAFAAAHLDEDVSLTALAERAGLDASKYARSGTRLLHLKNSSLNFGAFQIMIGLVFRGHVRTINRSHGHINGVKCSLAR